MPYNPIFWYRDFFARRNRLRGDSVNIDTGISESGERSIRVSVSAMHSKSFSFASTAGDILPAIPGYYYIIRGYELGVRLINTDTTTNVSLNYIRALENDSSIFGFILTVPSVAGSYHTMLSNLAIETAENTVVSYSADAAPTYGRVVVYYDLVPGRK